MFVKQAFFQRISRLLFGRCRLGGQARHCLEDKFTPSLRAVTQIAQTDVPRSRRKRRPVF